MRSTWAVLGIDPAPSKHSVVYDGNTFLPVPPYELRAFVEEQLRAHPATLISWDAPLSFDRRDHYDRAIDKAARRWVRAHEEAGRFEPRAISARPFAGLPHWSLSCSVLGLPFGSPPGGLRLARSRADLQSAEPHAIEVHPTVAIGAWWIETGQLERLPRYKGLPSQCARITAALELDAGCALDDDRLDAFVAYRLGLDFIEGRASWAGDATAGGYVMTDGNTADSLRQFVEAARAH